MFKKLKLFKLKINVAKIQKGLVAAAAALGLIANTAFVNGTTGKYVTDAIGLLSAAGVILLKNEPNLLDAANLINKIVGRQVVTVDTSTPTAPVVATAAHTGVVAPLGSPAPQNPPAATPPVT